MSDYDEGNTAKSGTIENWVSGGQLEIKILREQNAALKAELEASTAIIKGAPWYRDIEILQQENAKLREALQEAEHYMSVMTNGPGDAPGTWLTRYKYLRGTE